MEKIYPAKALYTCLEGFAQTNGHWRYFEKNVAFVSLAYVIYVGKNEEDI